MEAFRFPDVGSRNEGHADERADSQNGAMTSETDEATIASTYTLECTDCAFETTVEGDYRDALDVADTHQQERGDAPTDHFVNLRLNGSGE